MMRFKSTICAKVDDLKIQYFLHDPDNNPDRYGDGHYYQKPGQQHWSGPWLGPKECREMYRDWLEPYYESLERKLVIYDRAPLPGTKRFLVKFEGILDQIAYDVGFLLWIVGPGFPSPMSAVIDAASPADIPTLFRGTVHTYGDIEISEISGTVDDICLELGLPHPEIGPS